MTNILYLVGAVVLAIGVVGIVLMICKVLRLKPPKGLLPLVAGAAILGFHIMIEYTWFDRNVTELPDSIVVAQRITDSEWWQPWTFVVPKIDQYIAFDSDALRTGGPDGQMAAAVFYFVARYNPTLVVRQVYDCATPRRIDLAGQRPFAEDGSPVESDWIEIAADDPLRASLCRTAGLALGG